MISLILKQLLGLGAIRFFTWTSSLQTIIAIKQAPHAPGNVSLSLIRFTNSRPVCHAGTGRRNNHREKQKYGFKTKTSYCQKQSHFTAEGAEIAEEGIFFVYKQNHSIIVENRQRRFPPCLRLRMRR